MKILYFMLFLACGHPFSACLSMSGSRSGASVATAKATGDSTGVSTGDSTGDSTGMEGTAYTVSGNQMPSPDLKPGPRQLNGVSASIYIFELTNSSQVTRSGQSPCYTAITTKLVRRVDTDDKGHFKVLLAPGRYSVFTQKNGLLCAGRRDDRNNIAPVDVVAGKMTKVECRVETDHKTVY